MSIPANATEKPSIAKVWRQVKGNAGTFVTIWGLIFLIFLTTALIFLASFMLTYWLGTGELLTWVGDFQVELEPEQIITNLLFSTHFAVFIILLPMGIVGSGMVYVLIAAVPVIYYTTDHCPKPGEIVDMLFGYQLWRSVHAGIFFAIATFIGFILCIIPAILVGLSYPLYVHYVFATDLSIETCLSRAVKKVVEGGGNFLLVSIYWSPFCCGLLRLSLKRYSGGSPSWWCCQ